MRFLSMILVCVLISSSATFGQNVSTAALDRWKQTQSSDVLKEKERLSLVQKLKQSSQSWFFIQTLLFMLDNDVIFEEMGYSSSSQPSAFQKVIKAPFDDPGIQKLTLKMEEMENSDDPAFKNMPEKDKKVYLELWKQKLERWHDLENKAYD